MTTRLYLLYSLSMKTSIPTKTKTEAENTSIAVAQTARRGRPTKAQIEERKVQADFLSKCDLDERALCTRVIRLNRENYWLASLMRQILQLDAANRKRVNIEDIRALLNNFDTIDTLATNARKLGPIWSDNPVLKAIRDNWAEIDEYKDSCDLRRIIESAHQK